MNSMAKRHWYKSGGATLYICMMAFMLSACSDSCNPYIDVENVKVSDFSKGDCGGLFGGDRQRLDKMTADIYAEYDVQSISATEVKYIFQPYRPIVSGDWHQDQQMCVTVGWGHFTAYIFVENYSLTARLGADDRWYKVTDSISGVSYDVNNVPNWLEPLLFGRLDGRIKDSTTESLLGLINGDISLPSSATLQASMDLSPISALAESFGYEQEYDDSSPKGIVQILSELADLGVLVSTDIESNQIVITKDKDLHEDLVHFLQEFRKENRAEVDENLALYGLSWGDLINIHPVVVPMHVSYE